MQNEDNFDRAVSQDTLFTSAQMPRLSATDDESIAVDTVASRREALPWRALGRIAWFFGTLVIIMFITNAMITTGLRRIRTSGFGASNQIMGGKVNAQVVIAGSSRALAHYDPRAIAETTGLSAYNVGRNGAQTDMQVAFLKAYLEHNRKPEVVIFNLDAFSFVTSRHVFDPVEYTPYLYDPELYNALRKINPSIWKSRYIPLYGYVVEDMNFTWVLGLKGFLGWSPREDYFLGFNPRSTKWTDEFQNLKANNREGVRFEIEPAGVQDIKDLISVCEQSGIQLIFVYSPEYVEMQSLTRNRAEVFALFQELSDRYNVPFWDYSAWEYGGNKDYFQNSQHLNTAGAEIFSEDVGKRLREYIDARPKEARNALVPAQASRPRPRD